MLFMSQNGVTQLNLLPFFAPLKSESSIQRFFALNLPQKKKLCSILRKEIV
jgi:hypothetical protein